MLAWLALCLPLSTDFKLPGAFKLNKLVKSITQYSLQVAEGPLSAALSPFLSSDLITGNCSFYGPALKCDHHEHGWDVFEMRLCESVDRLMNASVNVITGFLCFMCLFSLCEMKLNCHLSLQNMILGTMIIAVAVVCDEFSALFFC